MNQRLPTQEHPLLSALIESPGEFGFFQSVAFLCALESERIPPGACGPFAQECVRFVHCPDLDFPAGDLGQITREEHDGVIKYCVQARFLGLTGAGTPLPLALVQELAQDDCDPATLEYLDLFHHRLYGLTFQAQHRLARVRGLGLSQGVRFAHPVLELLSPALPRAGVCYQHLDPESLLDFAPVLCQGAVGIDSIETSLAHALQRELGADGQVELVPLTGAFVQLDADEQWSLGYSDGLGQSTMLGARAFAPGMGATLKVNELPWDLFLQHWQEGAPVYAKIQELWKLLVTDPIALDLQLQVVECPTVSTEDAWSLGSHRLGHETWLLGPSATTMIHHMVVQEDRELR